jgi:hypothetical protein
MLCLIEIQATFAVGDMATGQARRGARVLYEALKSQYQLVAMSSQTEDITKWWLRSNGMADWSLIRCWDKEWSHIYTEWQVHLVADFLASGWEIGMFIDSYDGIITPVQRMHVPTMMVSYPAHGPGFFDPEKPPRAWATVADDPGGDHGPG